MNTTSQQLLRTALFASSLAISASACFDTVVNDVCTYNMKTYAAGAKFPAADGCNSCSCAIDGSVSCTEIACVDGGVSGSDAGSSQCVADGKQYKVGDVYPLDCNSCQCTSSGPVCTLKACNPSECSPQEKFYTPGCGSSGVMFAPGCYQPCAGPSDNSCGSGESCQAVSVNPCYNPDPNAVTCAACGAEEYLCLPSAGGSCTVGNKTYPDGASFPDPTSCNSCFCEDGQVGCTLAYCPLCRVGDKTYKPGDKFPDPTSCNTCSCDENGQVSCTEAHCPVCRVGDNTYKPGETFKLDCNTCKCGENGSFGCTKIACSSGCSLGDQTFPVGSSVICADGCNQCACQANGSWVSTLIACEPQQITKCTRAPSSLAKAKVLYLDKTRLAVEATFPGCANEGQKYTLCYDGAFRESSPVQTSLFVEYNTTATCSAMATGQRVFDLSPLHTLYQQSYPNGNRELSLQLQGGSLLYKW